MQPDPSQMQRLESILLPDEVDLSWSLGKGQTHINLAIKPAWIPQYLSNQDPVYEEQEDMATCHHVELVSLSKGYTIHFAEDPANSSATEHGRSSQYIENAAQNFQHLLTTLTGLDLLATFSITALRGLRRDLSADVLCFRKQGDTKSRVALRWKGRDGATPGWTTATLASILEVVSRDKLLKVELVNRQDGHALVLAGATATGAKANKKADKQETWKFQVNEGSVYPFELNTCEHFLSHLLKITAFRLANTWLRH